MNTILQVVKALTRITGRKIPIQRLYNLLNRHILQGELDLDLRHNCHYTKEEFMEALTYASLTRSAIELGCDRLRALGCIAPTGHTVRDKLRGKTVEEVEQEAGEEIRKMVGSPAPVFNGPVTVAVDIHKNPYYGERGDPYVVGGRRKASTTKFHAYATAYIVRDGVRFTLAATMMRPGEKPHHLLERLLDRVEEMVEVKRVLADAGFYSVPCIRLLKARGLRYTIHGEARGRRIQGMLEQVEGRLPEQGDALYLGEYVLDSSRYGKAKVKLLAARAMEDKPLHVYAVPIEEARKAYNVYGEYEHRFGIDTSYRMIREVWAWTRSKSASLRAFLFFLAVLIYNLWVLAKAIGRQVADEGGIVQEERLQMMMWFLRLTVELRALIGEVIHLA